MIFSSFLQCWSLLQEIICHDSYEFGHGNFWHSLPDHLSLRASALLQLRSPAQVVRRLPHADWRKLPQNGDSSNHRAGYRHLDTGWKWRRNVQVLPDLGWGLQVGWCHSWIKKQLKRFAASDQRSMLWSLMIMTKALMTCTWACCLVA